MTPDRGRASSATPPPASAVPCSTSCATRTGPAARSALRAEALILLRDGLNAHLDPDTLPAEPRPEGRLAKRRAAYHAAIAACSDFRARLDAAPRPLLERAAETGSATPFPA